MTVDGITRIIAAHVKRRRRELGLSQEALGAAIRAQGCERWSRTSVQKLETGRRESVTVEELLALATVLNVSPAQLLPEASLPPESVTALLNIRDQLTEALAAVRAAIVAEANR